MSAALRPEPSDDMSARMPSRGVVFVQTAATDGNTVVAHARGDDGTLSLRDRYPTGGLGGALGGAVTDHLASQCSLAFDDARGLLFATDAGSDALVMFPASGDQLGAPMRFPSGGSFPVSVALHDDLVFVLNGRGGGSIQGFRHGDGGLVAIDGSFRSLALDTMLMPEFTHTPGQIGFSPDGSQLVVTTKADDAILVFAMGADGRPAPAPRRHDRPGSVPFGFLFSPTGHLVVAEAGTSSLSTFVLGPDGSLRQLDTTPTGERATCWVTGTRDLLFASNAGTSTLSSMRIDADGHLTLLATTPTSQGTEDAAVSADGLFLYVQGGGAGVVDELAIGAGGDLTPLGSLAVVGARGGEGIVAR